VLFIRFNTRRNLNIPCVANCGYRQHFARESVLMCAGTFLSSFGGREQQVVTTFETSVFTCAKNGLVRDVFYHHMHRFSGQASVFGHVSSYTVRAVRALAGSSRFMSQSLRHILWPNNGNLTNVDELSTDLFRTDLRHINTIRTRKCCLTVFAHGSRKWASCTRPKTIFLPHGAFCHERCRGAYAVIAWLRLRHRWFPRRPNVFAPSCLCGVRLASDGSNGYI